MIAQTTVTDGGVSALDIVTLVIAIAGFGLGVASLVWNVVAHVATGVRVDVLLTCGYVGNGGYAHWQPSTSDRPFASGLSGAPVFGVIVHNTGRLPAVVTNVSIGTPVMALSQAYVGPSPRLPHQIEVSADATWFMNFADIAALLDVSSKAKTPTSQLVATVGLGSGKSVRSKPASGLKALQQLREARP